MFLSSKQTFLLLQKQVEADLGSLENWHDDLCISFHPTICNQGDLKEVKGFKPFN